MAKVVRSVEQMKRLSLNAVKKGLKIGFIPTMGYLHDGHLSLVKEAVKRNNFVVVSIFVNPTQFGPGEDLNKYPRDLKRDIKLLSTIKVDAIFVPDASDMYPEGYGTYVEVDGISNFLCGKSRPGHFRGVATVVAKLVNIVRPDTAYFGQKDYQQLLIIKRMVRDLNMPVDIIGMPIVREKDGLAMSSRNKYLSAEERQKAPVLYKALKLGAGMLRSGINDRYSVIGKMKKEILKNPGIKIDYIEICDAETLKPKKGSSGKTLIALAVFIGKTRLIDNILV